MTARAALWVGMFVAVIAQPFPSAARELEERATSALLAARRAGDPLPSVVALAPDLDLAGAYRIQKRFVQTQLGAPPGVLSVGGYKAGFTSAASRRQLGLSAPIAGVLPATGRLEGHVAVRLEHFHKLWFETELAFEVGKAPAGPLADVTALAAHLRAVRAAIELPDVTLASIDPLEPRDLVAANVLASHFLLGPPFSLDTISAEPLPILVRRDGEEVHATVFQDREELFSGLLWLINHLLREGYPIEPGMILLSGAQGPPRAAAPGAHIAQFGPLGDIRFDVR